MWKLGLHLTPASSENVAHLFPGEAAETNGNPESILSASFCSANLRTQGLTLAKQGVYTK